MKIGVLALQGAFIEHIQMLERLGADCVEIRQPKDLKNIDGLVFPGGESTVIVKLLHELKMFDKIKQAIENGLPVFGTCAGLILLAKTIEGESLKTLGVMDIVAKRNAYGRQLGSFAADLSFAGIGDVKAVFIRAPYIVSAAKNVEILSLESGKIVAAKQNNILATAFHPELTADSRVHQYFLSMINKVLRSQKLGQN